MEKPVRYGRVLIRKGMIRVMAIPFFLAVLNSFSSDRECFQRRFLLIWEQGIKNRGRNLTDLYLAIVIVNLYIVKSKKIFIMSADE